MKISINTIDKLRKQAINEFESADTTQKLENLKVKYLGRKSKLTKILRSIKDLPDKEKGIIGSAANKLQNELNHRYEEKYEKLKSEEIIENSESIDVTAPGKKSSYFPGHINPVIELMCEIQDTFQKMGFEVFEPYDIDDDYHNFQTLNIPEGHPARDIWDTFWTENGYIPITHTSSMQNRVLSNNKPPIRAIVTGHTFRNERTDARHEHTLYQCEGIYVDKGITLTDMIGTLKIFFSSIFEKDIEVQVTPDFFPFVEPGNGMSLSCFLCEAKGCRVCKGTGWLEILGCGMIHPKVLEMGGVDPEIYSGFAWGFGVDRLAMLKYGIEDVRHFRSGDLRFVKQF